MGFYIYDSNGYVGDLASNRGLFDLADYIEKQPDADYLLKLFEEGSVLKTEHLLEEVRGMGLPKDPTIAETLSNLKTLIERSSNIVIITDGVGFSEEGEE